MEKDEFVPGGFRGSTKSFFCDCNLAEEMPLEVNPIATHLRVVHNYGYSRSMADAFDIVVAAKLRLATGGRKG